EMLRLKREVKRLEEENLILGKAPLFSPRGSRAHRSPAASARIHPVLRRSGPSRASRNSSADAAVRSCWNSGLIHPLTSRNDGAQRSSRASIAPPVVHDPRIMVTHGFRVHPQSQL